MTRTERGSGGLPTFWQTTRLVAACSINSSTPSIEPLAVLIVGSAGLGCCGVGISRRRHRPFRGRVRTQEGLGHAGDLIAPWHSVELLGELITEFALEFVKHSHCRYNFRCSAENLSRSESGRSPTPATLLARSEPRVSGA